MSVITKKRKVAQTKVDSEKAYSLEEASSLLKEVNTASFDASVDIHVSLGVNPTKPDQAIRGTANMPNGTGKSKSVLVFCMPDKEQEAKDAGADYVGLDEFVDKIEGGWTDIDVVVAAPNVMPKIAKLGRVLGPRNLMPNPKSGTVTDDVATAVKDVKGGKIAFKVDKYGIIHSSIGRISFDSNKIEENATEFIQTLAKLKPSSAKGVYFKKITLATTMSPGIKIDTKSISGI